MSNPKMMTDTATAPTADPEDREAPKLDDQQASGEAEGQYSWKFAMKTLEEKIQSESTVLSVADIVTYELSVLKHSFLPMLLVLVSLLALLLPYYRYAVDAAIPALEEDGFVPDAAKVKELQLCPQNAGDDCVDPRFVMTYGMQQHFGQLYASVLPRIPPYLLLTMVVVPVTWSVQCHVSFCACNGPLAKKPDGTQSTYTDVWATNRLIMWPTIIGTVLFTFAQSAKAVGSISSRLGSLLTIVAVAGACVAYYIIIIRNNGDRQMMKGYCLAGLPAGACAVITNQYAMKSVSTDAHLCIPWASWVIIGEICMGYFRLCVRRLDLKKCDTHTTFLLTAAFLAGINTCKRIPLLCLTEPLTITIMIAACFIVEVVSRITVVRRDEFFDRCVRRQSREKAAEWRDSLRRQVYLHNEMLQEIYELIYPVPLGIALYLIKFSPTGEPVDAATIAVNCVMQVLIEFVADGCAIYYGSKYQSKFYRVAASNMWDPYRYKLMCVLIAATAFGSNGFYFYTYLRVGKTPDGNFLTLM